MPADPSSTDPTGEAPAPAATPHRWIPAAAAVLALDILAITATPPVALRSHNQPAAAARRQAARPADHISRCECDLVVVDLWPGPLSRQEDKPTASPSSQARCSRHE